MTDFANFAGQNWLITPAALAVGEHPPANIHDQKWLLVLSSIIRKFQREQHLGLAPRHLYVPARHGRPE